MDTGGVFAERNLMSLLLNISKWDYRAAQVATLQYNRYIPGPRALPETLLDAAPLATHSYN
jgi:hypothetical protein